ncbi:MAG: hypothetical protein IJL52_01315 [Clostridia bacterium]|nr:hypothetical protein [Clostridia bacterium]
MKSNCKKPYVCSGREVFCVLCVKGEKDESVKGQNGGAGDGNKQIGRQNIAGKRAAAFAGKTVFRIRKKNKTPGRLAKGKCLNQSSELLTVSDFLKKESSFMTKSTRIWTYNTIFSISLLLFVSDTKGIYLQSKES